MLAQKAIPKIYLIIGDSGAGKSSFINSLGGRDEDDEMAETGHGGDAVTMTPGKIYKVDVSTFFRFLFYLNNLIVA